jgi:hypothetical protein
MLLKSFDLMSPLARDECVRRLQANTASPWARLLSTKPVVGRVEDTSFRIRKRLEAFNNPFQPHLWGELLDEDGRTRVRCRFGMNEFVVIFMAFWLSVVLIAGGPVAISAIASLLRGGAQADAWRSIVMAAAMPAFGVAFVGLGLFSARNERRFLLDFLRGTIAAREP